jgi:putative ABC transport system permease protein
MMLRRFVDRLRRRGASSAELERGPAVRLARLDDVRRGDRFTVQDLVVEASAGIGARPTRLIMTTLGTVLGIGSLVVTIGFAQTAAGQIAKQFDAVAATQVVIAPGETSTGQDRATVVTAVIPWDAPERLERLVGVVAAGTIAEVPLPGVIVTAVPVNDPAQPPTFAPRVAATSPELLEAVRGEIVTGRYFDRGHDERGDRVAVLGIRAAEQLGVTRIDLQPSIFIDGLAYAVIGIIDGVERRSDLLDSVIIPMGTARSDFRLVAPGEVQVQIDIGAGPIVAEQAPVALSPNAPDGFDISAPGSPSDLRQNVQADVNLVFLVLGLIALAAGGLGIANVTMLSVMERIGEIGLRRAVGATSRQIASQFMVESIIIGLLGGLIGSALGTIAVVVVSAVQGWTPVLDPWFAIGAALLGAVVGLLAGTAPAVRASRIEPISALRAT